MENVHGIRNRRDIISVLAMVMASRDWTSQSASPWTKVRMGRTSVGLEDVPDEHHNHLARSLRISYVLYFNVTSVRP